MDRINKLWADYGQGEDDRLVSLRTGEIISNHLEKYRTVAHLKRIFGMIDLTSLNTQDDSSTARRLARLVNEFPKKFPSLSSVAAICVYPALVEELRSHLLINQVKLAAVGACFPSSQSFLAVKLAECELLMSKGVDEIDVVISVGRLLSGDGEGVLKELLLIRDITKGVHLKVILETGILKSSENIRMASLIAMEAGADFIKTSTGKVEVGATPEAVYVMAKAIRDYFSRTGRAVGLKPSGGISSVYDALIYYTLISEILGEEWQTPRLLRFGASRLCNNLLSEITQEEVKYF